MILKNNEVVEKTINFLLNILIVVFSIFLMISVYIGFQTRIIGNDYANFFGYSLFEVQSGSMEGTIDVGDWIIVKLSSKVKVDDIITYQSNGEYVTHRIIEVYKGTYITKGDANNSKDDPIDQNQIVGKVVKILGNFGIIRKTMFNPAVLLTLIITLYLFHTAFKKEKINLNNKNISDIKERVTLFIKSTIDKIKSFIESKQSNNEFYRRTPPQSNFLSDIKKEENFYDTKEYEKLEEELSKTALYRMVSVEGEEVAEDFKVLAPKNKTPEEIEDELGKTSLYRMVPVSVTEVSEKYKSLELKVDTNTTPESKPHIEKYAELEDELGKTSIFRVISVDTEDVDNVVAPKEKEPDSVEDLENTSHYRFVTVDTGEVDNTLLEIAEHEVKESKQKENLSEKEAETEIEEISEDNEEESLTTINLDLLKSKNARKGKNIIDKVMIIKKEELNELIDILVKEDHNYVYRANVKNKFLVSYTDAKYYNYYGTYEMESRGRSLTSKIKKIIKEQAISLIDEYVGKDTKYSSIVDKYTELFTLIADLEQARDAVTDTKAKKEFYKKELNKYYKELDVKKVEKMINDIMRIQKRYLDTIDYFLQKLETNMFNLKLNKINGAKNAFGLELVHNLTFNKVYSEYIIDKTYTEGIVAEDKISVTLSLLSLQLINDMTNANYDRKYVFYIPSTLYTKVKKMARLLKMIDNEYAKHNTIILITYEDLLLNKQLVKDYRKAGYKFGLMFNKDNVLLKKNQSSLYIPNCLFINKKDKDMDSIISAIPEELSNKIISDDIVTKVGDLGGE
ncbi:MAG: signal peptidase I [Bacilli bacterium]|nr:signal peptidase I [Bacilli bacterium]